MPRAGWSLSVCILLFTSGLSGQELHQLAYNNPGLAVDLGVGLWAWPVPCDADGDGDYDLIISCPDKPSNGVWLFENTTGDTAKNKFPVFQPGKRLSSTVHYVMPSYVDGQLRVLSPGYEYSHFMQKGLTDRTKLSIDPKFYKPTGKQPKGPKVRHNQWRYADYDGDGATDLIVGIEDWSYYGWDNAWNAKGEWENGPLHGFVFLFRNTGTTAAPQYAEPVKVEADGKPVDVFGCPSPNFEDFDGDGDLDLLCGEFLDGFTYFENIGTRTEPKYAAGERLKQKDGTPLAMDLEMIVPIAFDWDRDGDIDLIVGDEDGRVALVEQTGLDASNRPVFNAPRYFQQVGETLKSGALATPVGYDWDGDGDIDLLTGNTAGYIDYFENLSGPGVEFPRWAAPVQIQVNGQPFRIMAGPNGSIQGPAEAKWGYSCLSISDWDGDGLPDIVTNGIWGRIQWLRNLGPRENPKLAPPAPIEVAWGDSGPTKPSWTWWNPQGNELVTQWRTTPMTVDWNKDGLVDLVMLDHEGYLCLYPRSKEGDKLVLNPPQRVFNDAKGPLRLNGGTAGGSGRRKLCIVDWDGDGQLDILANSTSANLLKQVSSEDGHWTFEDRGPLVKQNIQGHSTCPTVVDFNSDGIPDFVGGAEDGRFYYQRNPRSPASQNMSAILKQEMIYNEAPFPQCHATTIEESDGHLVAAWFGGTKEKDPDVGIWVSRQVDGKWTTPVEVANGVQYTKPDGLVHRHPCWNPVLFQPRSGPLMLFYKCGPDPRTWWGMLMTSTDHGATWSIPRRLPEQIDGPVKNKPVQLPNGDILCGSSTEYDGWRAHFELTSDLGKTWTRIGPVNDGKAINSIQPSILFLGGDQLQAMGRTREGKLFQIRSDDLGKTWGDMTLTDLPNPNSGTDAVTLKDGRHLLVYNHTPKGRSPLNVAVSEDGHTWKAALVLESEPGEYSYPAVIQTQDGLVHITYTWKRQKVRHVVINPEYLELRPFADGKWPE